MLDWLFMCYEDPSLTAEVLVPGDMEPFEQPMMRDVPARLDLNSWVAPYLMQHVAEEIFPAGHAHAEICECKEWTEQDEVGQIHGPVEGEAADFVCLVGEAIPGCVVWSAF